MFRYPLTIKQFLFFNFIYCEDIESEKKNGRKNDSNALFKVRRRDRTRREMLPNKYGEIRREGHALSSLSNR